MTHSLGVMQYLSSPGEVTDVAQVLFWCLEAVGIWMAKTDFASTLTRLSGFGFGEPPESRNLSCLFLGVVTLPQMDPVHSLKSFGAHNSCLKSK